MIRQHTSVMGLQFGFALLTALAAQTAFAQQADPGFAVSRTVNPRIAYRGVPVEDNPIHVRATTFPAQIFHGTLGDALDNPADDAVLGGNTGSLGIVIDATQSLLAPTTETSLLHGPATSGGTPLGMGASAGGAISGATQGFANTLTNGTITSGVLGAAQAASSSSSGRGQ